MISVCIATYNGALHLAQQLESILQQLSSEDEVVISDDHSTDATLRIAQEVAAAYSTPIRIFINPKAASYVANFENALRHSQGDIIFLSDQDDVWLPGKVEACCQSLQDASIVVHDAQVVCEDLSMLHLSFQSKRRPLPGWWGTMIRFSHLGCCLAFRREVLNKALPFPPNRTLCTHDNWIFLVGQTFGKAMVLSQPLIAYRRHKDNISGGGVNEHKNWFFRIHYRFYLLWHILLRRCFYVLNSSIL